MRQANFPDQKALTARDGTNSESNQPGLVPWKQWSPTVRLEQPRDKGYAKQKTFLLFKPATHTTGTGHPLHCFGHPCGRQLTSSSELLSPYAKLPHGWSRPGIFPESHLPPSFRRWPWLHTPRPLPDWAHVGRTVLTVPFLTGPSSFPWSTPESPWQEELERVHCWPRAGARGAGRGVRLLHSRTTSGWDWASAAQFLCTDFFFFFPFSGFKIFLFIFLNGRYPTLNKIKLKTYYTLGKTNRATFLQEKLGLKSMAL